MSLATQKLLALLAVNEQAEVAFFTQFLANFTNKDAAFSKDFGTATLDPAKQKTIIDNLKSIIATEQLHEISVNDFNIVPCAYQFPVTTYDEAVKFAATFTDVSVGVLANIQQKLSRHGDGVLIPTLGSVLGNEASQEGFFHTLEGQLGARLPFLTASSSDFLFSILHQKVIVPGSCDATNITFLGTPDFPALVPHTPTPEAKAQDLFYTVNLNKDLTQDVVSKLSITYINQQNIPIQAPIKVVGLLEPAGTVLNISATFPYENPGFGNGLTYATLTSGGTDKCFADADAVARATVYGPALIQI